MNGTTSPPSSTLSCISSPLQLPFLDEGYPMANITTQGRLRSVLCSNDGMIISLNSKIGCATWGGMLRFNGGKPTSGSSCQCRKRSNSWGQKSKRWSPEAEFFVSNDGILEEGPEFQEDDLSFYRGLVLDISYRPVNVVCWKRAICLEFMEKADVLEYYDQSVNSPSGSFYIPAVLRVPHLLQVVKRRRVKKNLSRKNILWRDNFMCQYCSAGESLTIDHILPITRGGEWTWENLVTACSRCNSTKGHKTPEEANMKLLKVPKAPKDYDIVAIPLSAAAIKMLRSRKGTPEEWQQYLSKPLP